jgi:hypothetical protein
VAFVVDNVDYYEADASTLPFLRRNLKSHGDDPLQVRDTLLVWWGKMLQSNQTAERASAMRVLTERLSADGANMTGLDYHGFSRVNINYGIFNLPVYITLIRKDNNPLAFMEFLCASSHPAYRELHLPANPVERLKIIAGKWPTQRERVEVVEQWWADDAAKYETTLPELAQSIIQAMKE